MATASRLSPLDAFLQRSGYSKEDLISFNERTKLFVTSNGGKYQLTQRGVRRLLGPRFPNEPEELAKE